MQEGAQQNEAAPMYLERFLHYRREGKVSQVRGWRRRISNVLNFGTLGMSIDGRCFHVDNRCFLHRWKTTDVFATSMFLHDIDVFNYFLYFFYKQYSDTIL